jgi:hypothetical protein
MGLLVRRAMKPVLGPISCLRLPGTIQHFWRTGHYQVTAALNLPAAGRDAAMLGATCMLNPCNKPSFDWAY